MKWKTLVQRLNSVSSFTQLRICILIKVHFSGRNETLITLPPVYEDLPEIDQSDTEYSSSFSTQFSILLARKTKQFVRNTVSLNDQQPVSSKFL